MNTDTTTTDTIHICSCICNCICICNATPPPPQYQRHLKSPQQADRQPLPMSPVHPTPPKIQHNQSMNRILVFRFKILIQHCPCPQSIQPLLKSCTTKAGRTEFWFSYILIYNSFFKIYLKNVILIKIRQFDLKLQQTDPHRNILQNLNAIDENFNSNNFALSKWKDNTNIPKSQFLNVFVCKIVRREEGAKYNINQAFTNIYNVM